MTHFDREYQPRCPNHSPISWWLTLQATHIDIFLEKENSSPHGPVSREKQHTAEAALLSEDRRRVLTAAYNGVSAGEARERLLQNPAVSLVPGLNLPPTEVSPKFTLLRCPHLHVIFI